MTKVELRKHYFSLQKSLSPAEKTSRSSLIADSVFNSVDLSEALVVHCFLSIEKFNEVETDEIFHGLWQNFPNANTVVPRVNFLTNEIESIPYSPESEILENVWNIREPTGDEILPPESIDVVLVPGLAFDLLGHRVGYGKGFYDRFLARCRLGCVKIGLSYFEPVERIEDTHAGDVQLDRVVTPESIYETGTREFRIILPSKYL